MSDLFDTKKDRINPAITLPAQTPALCTRRKEPIIIGIPFLDNLNKNKTIGITEKAVIELQFLYGLRIQEVLKIKNSDISPYGQIFINTEKTGEPRVITPLLYANFWLQPVPGALPLIDIYSRFYFYRLYKKLGYYKKYGENERNSVTHYFRHELVQNLQAAGFDDKNISKFLAHRSQKTLQFYAKK